MPAFGHLIFTILFALTVFNASTSGAQQGCRLPGDIDTLIVNLQLSLSTPGALSSPQRARLTAIGEEIDRSALERELRRADLQPTQNAISTIVDAAQKITADGFIADRARLEDDVEAALSLVRSLCADRANRIDQQLTRLGIVRQLDDQASLQRRPPSPLEVPDGGSVYVLLLLAPLILGVTAIIILFRRVFEWVQTFAFTRKSCFVAAAVEHDLDIIDGHILIIGRRHVKFQPVDEESFQRLADLGEGEYMLLIIGHHRLPGQVQDLGEDFATFFFTKAIQKDFIEILLQSSAVTPRYVRMPPPKRKRKSRSGKGRKASSLTPV